ncbi:MAG: threonine/serine exporter family protein [Acidobacteria bacterium]|nr:MAG: threonine/serine exporter family protein [Acidobacteriota bacterium]REK10082.1 MAG: threonine/serine exporter family protein [Acidobacteriota bacterium]
MISEHVPGDAAPGSTTPAPSAAPPPTRQRIADRDFVIRLALALHSYGTPVHRLESAIGEVSAALGLEVSVFATPTAVFTSFRDAGVDDTRFDRQNSGEVDLGKLAELDELARRVIAGELDPSAGAKQVDELVKRPARGRGWKRWAAYGIASAGFAIFFGAAPAEVLWALVLGSFVGTLEGAMVPGRWQQLFEPTGAVLIALAAGLLAATFGTSAPVLTVAGIIVLVPGLSLTQSVTELAQGSLVSGSSRFLGTMLSFLMLGFGSELGRRLATLLVTVPEASMPSAWPLWQQLGAVTLSSMAFAVIFRARRKDVGAIVALSLVTYLVIHAVRPSFGAVFTALVGALVVGCGSNAFARVSRRPSLVLRVPVMLILVPGSFGLRSVLMLVEADVLHGVETAFTMLFLAVALAAGLLTANALVQPRQRL